MPKIAITDYTFPSLDIEEGILAAVGCDVARGQCKNQMCSTGNHSPQTARCWRWIMSSSPRTSPRAVLSSCRSCGKRRPTSFWPTLTADHCPLW